MGCFGGSYQCKLDINLTIGPAFIKDDFYWDFVTFVGVTSICRESPIQACAAGSGKGRACSGAAPEADLLAEHMQSQSVKSRPPLGFNNNLVLDLVEGKAYRE